MTDNKQCKVCQTWARTDGRMTNHHPKCPSFVEERYLKASMDGAYYVVPESSANTLFADIGALEVGDKLTVEIVTMTKEEYDRLPEFTGF